MRAYSGDSECIEGGWKSRIDFEDLLLRALPAKHQLDSMPWRRRGGCIGDQDVPAEIADVVTVAVPPM